jgi:hypothetical protein
MQTFGYRYINEDTGESAFIEFHIDYFTSRNSGDNDLLLLNKNPKMSVRAPPNSIPIAIFGQDESIFSQFIIPSKSWIDPNQKRGLFPKSLGEGLMISAFVSRDCSGFVMPVNAEQLNEINTCDKARSTLRKRQQHKSTQLLQSLH